MIRPSCDLLGWCTLQQRSWWWTWPRFWGSNYWDQCRHNRWGCLQSDIYSTVRHRLNWGRRVSSSGCGLLRAWRCRSYSTVILPNFRPCLLHRSRSNAGPLKLGLRSQWSDTSKSRRYPIYHYVALSLTWLLLQCIAYPQWFEPFSFLIFWWCRYSWS